MKVAADPPAASHTIAVDDSILTAPLAGWLSGLAAVPDAVFANGLMGEGLAIDPIQGVLHAPCPATVVALHAAGHAITLRGASGFELLLHVGIDTVAQAGRGFRALVGIGDTVARGTALIAFDLDALLRSVTALITPMVLIDSTRYAWAEAEGNRLVAVGDRIGRIAARGSEQPHPVANGNIDADLHWRDVAVELAHGIHARPAARIAAAARAHAARGRIVHAQRGAALTSLVELMGLGLSAPGRVRIEAGGSDAAALLDAVAAILGEQEAVDPMPRGSVLPATSTAIAAATGTAAAPAIPTTAAPVAWGRPVGVAAAPGMAMGPACWWSAAVLNYEERSGAAPASERARLDSALAQVAAELDRSAALPGARGAVLAAHRGLLEDTDLRARADAALAAGLSAPAAIRDAAAAQIAVLRGTGDARIAERADDLKDVARRVIAATLGQSDAAFTPPPGAILLAVELLPSQLLAFEGHRLGGICLQGGGPTSHVAILAAGMGLPMLVAAGAAIEQVADSTPLILDADQGLLAIDPDAATCAAAEAALAARTRREAEAAKLPPQGRLADGLAVPVFANLGALADAHSAAERGAEGCGLLRTEFLFLDRELAPEIEEQTAQYQAIADALGDRPLVVRLLDVGGDKPAAYLKIAPEENPALGVRGIRVALAHPELLDAQLRAILAVRPAGRCRILVPMVSHVQELVAVRTRLQRLCESLGIGMPPLGIMVETPAAAIGADLFARDCDFFSIGSNDLTQYTLAMDRGNAATAGGIDGLHPAVLRLIAATCEGAARHARSVSLCGGLAAESLAVPILIGLGVRTLSVPPARIAPVRGLLARLTLEACAAHARAALEQTGPEPVRALARAFAQEHMT